MEKIEKYELEEIIRTDLIKIINTDRVYKYVDFEDGLNKILKKNTLKFTNPVGFNDPFDCNEHLLRHDNNKELINSTLENSFRNIPRHLKRKMAKQLLNPNHYSEILRKEREQFRLSCFSSEYDEVLMWSHYANKHQGICIGFNFPYKYEDRFILCHVKYLDRIIPLDGNSDMQRIILYWLTTKSIRWAYENEIRAISTSGQEIIHFEKTFVKEIIFGCNVTNNKIDNTLIDLKKNGYDLNKISIKKMEISQESFLLKEKIIKPSL